QRCGKQLRGNAHVECAEIRSIRSPPMILRTVRSDPARARAHEPRAWPILARPAKCTHMEGRVMRIVTSLSFRGQCREAFEFYAKVLGGKITAAMPYGDGAPDMPVGPEHRDWLMHCWLDVGDQALMGADMDTAWAPNI